MLPRGEEDSLLELYSDRLFGEGVGPELELIRAYARRGSLATALEVGAHPPHPPHPPHLLCTSYAPPPRSAPAPLCTLALHTHTSEAWPPPTHLSQVYRLCSAASSPVLGELRAARRGPHGHSEPAQLLDAALR